MGELEELRGKCLRLSESSAKLQSELVSARKSHNDAIMALELRAAQAEAAAASARSELAAAAIQRSNLDETIRYEWLIGMFSCELIVCACGAGR